MRPKCLAPPKIGCAPPCRRSPSLLTIADFNPKPAKPSSLNQSLQLQAALIGSMLSVSTVERVRLSGRMRRRRVGRRWWLQRGWREAEVGKALVQRSCNRCQRTRTRAPHETRSKHTPSAVRDKRGLCDKSKRRNRTRYESRSTRLLRSCAVYKSARVVIRKSVTGRCPRSWNTVPNKLSPSLRAPSWRLPRRAESDKRRRRRTTGIRSGGG